MGEGERKSVKEIQILSVSCTIEYVIMAYKVKYSPYHFF